MQRLRFALRSLARRPGFTAVAVLTLALGIGANAAIFSVVDAVLLRPLPYPRADRIVIPWEYSREVQQRLGFDRLPSSAADFVDFATRNSTFDYLASMRGDRLNITEGEPERIGAVLVSPDFFDVLGLNALLGRTFRQDDAQRGRTVVIAHSLWVRRFGGDPGIPGRSVSLNGVPATIVGVLPPGFNFPASGDLPESFGFTATPEIWTLDILRPDQRRNRGGKSLVLIGRMKEQVSIAQAESDLAVIAEDIARESPASNAGWSVRVISLREQLVARLRPPLMVLLTAVGFVLLIACANVANLLLVRATARHRELTVRAALGGSRRRLVVDLLIESMVLALAAGLAGLAIAWWTLHALVAAAPANLPAVENASIDPRVLAFTLLVSTITGIAFGLAPALQATHGDLTDGLREGGRGTAGGRHAHRMRGVLVVVEVALAVVLLVGASLLLQTFVRLTRVNTGFDADRVLTMEIALPPASYEGDGIAQFFDRLIERLAVLPGVEVAGATSGLPLSGHEHLTLVTVEGAPRPEPGTEVMSDYRAVTNGYFAALRIPIRAGAWLPERPPDGVRPVLVNETMARTAWPGQSPLGRRLKLAAYDQDSPWLTVSGVVGDTRQGALETALRPQVYTHQRHAPAAQMAVVMRTDGDATGLARAARAAVGAIDPLQPVTRVRTMDEVLGASVAGRRFQVMLVGALAALAVSLSLVGLYAVVAYSVAERVHELGVRVALGARPSNLLALVLTDGLRLVALGIGIGVAVAFVLTRFLETQLFGVRAHDPATFVLVPVALFIAALLGCLVPARRAMRVDPSAALRSE